MVLGWVSVEENASLGLLRSKSEREKMWDEKERHQERGKTVVELTWSKA